MKHLGDITKISGYDAPVVDCIVGGSPCQDLSVAGLRKGLAGERSGLFLEQIRIIKEMREADVLRGRSGQFIRPRFAVWENVPGAQSSGSPKGADFAAVLTEFVRIAEPEAPPVSVPEKGWPSAGCLIDEMGAWSVAWRILDGQYWGNALLDDEGNILKHGTPQRRRRIALVADLGGRCAPEILFERTGLRGYPPQGGTPWQAAPAHAQGGPGADDREGESAGAGRGRQLDAVGCSLYNLALSGDKAVSLTTSWNATGSGPTVAIPYTLKIRSGCEGGGKGALVQEDKSATLATNNDQYLFQPVTYDARGNVDGQTVNTITGDHNNRITDYSSVVIDGAPAYSMKSIARNGKVLTEQANPICASDYKDPDIVAYGVDCRNATEYPGMTGTLQAKANGDFSLNCNQIVRVQHIVRRLTPGECELLQGYPKGWTDIGDWVDSGGKVRKCTDSARYKALGNSICLPPWKWVLKRLCAHYERDATLASLFDGIGGFPLIWEQLNGKGTCLWASEIEEFPMAVTKKRFGGTE